MHHSFTRHTGVLAALLLAGCPADPSTTTEGSTTTVAATDTATGATMTGATMTGTTIDPGPTTGAATDAPDTDSGETGADTSSSGTGGSTTINDNTTGPGVGGDVAWSQVLDGEGVALAVGADFVAIAGALDGQLWVERRGLDGEPRGSATYGAGAAQDVAALATPPRIAVGGFVDDAAWLGLLDDAGALQWDTLLDEQDIEGLSRVRVAFTPDDRVLCARSGFSGVDEFPHASASTFTLEGMQGALEAGSDGEFGGLAVGPDGQVAFALSTSGALGVDGRTRLFAGGQELWAKDEFSQREPRGAAIDGLGRVFTVGSGGEIRQGGWLVQRDADGATGWTAETGPGPWLDAFEAVTVDGAGNVAITGRVGTDAIGGIVITIRFDAGGSTLWVAEHKGTGDHAAESGLDVATDGDGAVYVLARESTQDGAQTRLIKYLP